MSVSIYYAARRTQPLTEAEISVVEQITQKHSVDAQIEQYLQTGRGLNWESFCWYKHHSAADVVLEGATKLPDKTADAMWIGIQHWCAALSEVRHAITGLVWIVSVNDHEIKWDEQRQLYDPTV